jgi:hypothetical protein
MKIRTHVVVCGLVVSAWAAMPAPLSAQARAARSGAAGVQGNRTGGAPPTATSAPDDPFQGPVVTNAPFSADAVTTVSQVLSDGTRIGETTNAKFYRDGAGRVRREQSVLGLGALNPSGEAVTTITIDPDPGDASAYTLNPANKTAHRINRATANSTTLFFVNGSGQAMNGFVINSPARLYTAGDGAVTAYNRALSIERQTGDLALRIAEAATPGAVIAPVESLGTRQMEGLTVVGRRTRTTIPTGQIGNDRPIEITDERWESPDLRLLVRSHHHDPRTGDIEYQLTNIVRAEPPADLFVVPADYKVDDLGFIRIAPVPAITEPGAGAGARGAGGARSGGQRSGAPAN